jgi:lipopolysaccharide export system protein LptC
MTDVSQNTSYNYIPEVSARGHRAIRRNFFVTRLKWGILGLVILLVLFLIIYPLTDYGRSDHSITFVPGDYSSGEELPTMVKPRLHGINANNQPYNVSADRAIQHGPKLIELVRLDADMFMDDGSWLTVASNSAMYDLNTRKIEMKGDVNVFVDNGYELATSVATAFVKTSMVKGNAPVVVHGPLGVIKANRFAIKGNAHRVAFSGDVRLRAYPRQQGKGK